jgi:hypothetical protein
MPRDRIIKRAFEIADDGMQGVIGYFFYGLACNKVSPDDQLIMALPKDAIPITHDWIRYYEPAHLIQAMNDSFEPYHSRVCLISIISMFEGVLSSFIDRLVHTGKITKPKKSNYKRRLEWAFGLALQSTYANSKRIPDLCLDVDHARRIRNLWMHNNGLLDEGYEDCIGIPGYTPIINPLFSEYKKNKKKKIPVIVTPPAFLRMVQSHIELMHQVHHFIQKAYFDQKKSYSYISVKKSIEWHRLLIGK